MDTAKTSGLIVIGTIVVLFVLGISFRGNLEY